MTLLIDLALITAELISFYKNYVIWFACNVCIDQSMDACDSLKNIGNVDLVVVRNVGCVEGLLYFSISE
jgi:hypothetical protein